MEKSAYIYVLAALPPVTIE